MRTRLPVSGCLLLSAVCLSSIAFAQTNWARTYGGTGSDNGNSVQQTSDGGFVIAGTTNSFGAGGNDIYLIKTNAEGDTQWTRTFGGLDDDEGYEVCQADDGGYTIMGTTYSFGAWAPDSSNVYLVRTNAQGDTLWTRTYGGTRDDQGYCVQLTSDGGYILAGWTVSFGSGVTDVYLVKVNRSGDTLWTRTYGGTSYDVARSVQQTADGGYIVAGSTSSFGPGHPNEANVYLIKTNAQGDTSWTRTFGGANNQDGYSVRQTTDGGYIIAGDAENGVYLIKTDASGDTLWLRTYGGWYNGRGYSVEQTTDGGYIVAASSMNFTGEFAARLIKTNVQGDTLWTRTYGGDGHDRARSVRQVAAGGYVLAGSTESFGAGGNDVYLIKTRGELDVGPVAILSPPGVVDSGISYVPRAVVRNFGLTSGSIVQVTLEIGSGYAQTVLATLVSVPLDTVVFPPWTAEPVGPIKVACLTAMDGDEDPANDTIVDSVQVLPPPFHDVGAVAIVSPTGSVRAGDTVIPRARIRNFGNRVERYFDVRFRVGANYNEKVNVAEALPAGSTAELTFPRWVAEAGNWAVSCSTMLGSDENRANDKVSSSLQVVPQSLSIAPDQSDRIEAGQTRTYRFYALIQGDTGGVVEVARPIASTGWSARLGDATGVHDLTDTDGDGMPDLGYVAPGESGWFSLDVTAPSATQGDTASLGQVAIPVAGHVGGRPDIADTAVLTVRLVPELSIHNFPNPFTDHTTFVIGLPEDGKTSLTVYTRTGERVCRVLANADLLAGVHLVRWDGVNDNGRTIAPGTYEYLLDYVHSGKTDRIHKRLVMTKE